MTAIKYDVSIPVGLDQEDIRNILKKYKVKFETESIENNFGVHGVEFLGHSIHFTTTNSDVLDEIRNNKIDASIVAYKQNLKKLYKIHWVHRKRKIDTKPIVAKKNCIDIPF